MIIAEEYYEEQAIHNATKWFIKKFNTGKILKKSNAYKSKGIPVIRIFIYLLELVFSKKSMYMNILNGTYKAGFQKDTAYRFLNCENINWSTLILNLSFDATVNLSKLTSEKRLNAFIIDDTFYGRQRSKKVELLANVHDHASKGNKYKRGFRMLTMGRTDGAAFVPLAARHLSSENKSKRYNEINPNIDKRSCGYKARKQAIMKAPAVMPEMLTQAVRIGIPAKHVLFDPWFSCQASVIEISKLNLFVVGRLKNTAKMKYLINGEEKTLSQIYSENKKRRGTSKYLLSVPVEIYTRDKNKKNYTQILPARIVFVRDRNNCKKWIAFISTGLSLSEEQVIALYGKRRDIEVFFRICKSYLNLGKEFQGLSYDAITSHTAIVMARCIMSALQKRENEDPRAIGELFFCLYDEHVEIADVHFAEVLEVLLNLLRESLNDLLFLSEEQIDLFSDAFISKIPDYYKQKFVAECAS